MMGFWRKQPRRARPKRPAAVARPEQLETRQLLSSGALNPIYTPSYLIHESRATTDASSPILHPIGTPARIMAGLDNDGKILTGKDRDGDEWQITVHGPGVVIVTDVTPNDGALGDEIDTIQIVGSNPGLTHVTGFVAPSARTITDGTINFNHLIALQGVHNITLNGFNLTRTVDPLQDEPANEGPEIYLPAGVGYLEFNNIVARIDLAFDDDPIEVVIGEENKPLNVAPRVRFGSIFNSVFDSSEAVLPNGDPPVDATVRLLINGDLHSLSMVSATAEPVPAGFQYTLPRTTITGRTGIQANGITRAKAAGSLRNTTLSRNERAFSSEGSGLAHLKKLKVGGVTDGLGVDVSRGPIGRVYLKRGLGDTTGALPGDINKGANYGEFGNAAFGLYGGLIVGKSLHKITSGPSQYALEVHQDPDYRQDDTTNVTKYYPRAGRTLINSAIVIGGSVDVVNMAGDLQASQINTGSDYTSYAAGLEMVRRPSRINALRLKGSLVDSVVAASYKPGNDGIYGKLTGNAGIGRARDLRGNGKITGNLVHGNIRENGQTTILGYEGTGFFARRKQGYLPPTVAPERVQSVNIAL